MAVKKEPGAPAPVVSDKKKALETAMQQIEKMYGKGSIMRYGCLLYTSCPVRTPVGQRSRRTVWSVGFAATATACVS